MAKKKKTTKPKKPKLDEVQNALRIVEEATGEKIAKPAKSPKSNGKH